MEDELSKQKKQVAKLQSELKSYKKISPEVAIFFKKKTLVQKLLKISIEDLKNAPEQTWYGEYFALLAIRFDNSTLSYMGRKYNEELLQWYRKNIKKRRTRAGNFGNDSI